MCLLFSRDIYFFYIGSKSALVVDQWKTEYEWIFLRIALTKIHFLFSFNGEKLNAGTEEGKMFLEEKILIAFLLSPACNEEDSMR
jgi:hypothetical protein